MNSFTPPNGEPMTRDSGSVTPTPNPTRYDTPDSVIAAGVGLYFASICGAAAAVAVGGCAVYKGAQAIQKCCPTQVAPER